MFILLVNIFNCMFNSVLNFTHELNKNNEISFFRCFDTNNNFTTSNDNPPPKKNTNNNYYTINFKSECLFQYEKTIINNLISYAKLIVFSKIIFYKELKNIKQTHQ